MKINEIIEPREVDRPVSTPYNVEKMGKKQNISVGGAYAKGTEDPKDPHMYRKKIRMPSILKNDAYFQYIKACSPYMKSNPYFPRVYEVVFKKYTGGLVKPAYNMEKLLTIEEAKDQIGWEELANGIGEKIYTEAYLKDRHVFGLTLSDIIGDIARAVRYGTEPNIFSDENLEQAIELIQKVKQSNANFEVDMHSGNFMIRLGTTGPQLVITDPLADRGTSIAAGYNPFTHKIVKPGTDDDVDVDEPL